MSEDEQGLQDASLKRLPMLWQLTWKQSILNLKMGPWISASAVQRRWGCWVYASSI